MVLKTVHCRVCGKSVKGANFASRMKKLRTHYRDIHPKKWAGWGHLKARVKSRVAKLKTYKPKRAKKGVDPMARKKAKVRKVYVKAKRGARRARGFLKGLGKGMSLKAMGVGAAALIAMQRFQPFGGPYKPALDKIVLGIALPAVKMDNSDFLSVGIKEAIATAVNSYLLGGGVTPEGGGML